MESVAWFEGVGWVVCCRGGIFIKCMIVINVSFRKEDVIVTEGGDGDYLHSILGMQTVFSFLVFLDFANTTCTRRLGVQVLI